MGLDDMIYKELEGLKEELVDIVKEYNSSDFIQKLAGYLSDKAIKDTFVKIATLNLENEEIPILTMGTDLILRHYSCDNKKYIGEFELCKFIEKIDMYLKVDNIKKMIKEKQMIVTKEDEIYIAKYPKDSSFESYIIDNNLETLNIIMNIYENDKKCSNKDFTFSVFYGAKIDKLKVNGVSIKNIKRFLRYLHKFLIKLVLEFGGGVRAVPRDIFLKDTVEQFAYQDLIFSKDTLDKILDILTFKVKGEVWQADNSLLTRPIVATENYILLIPILFLNNDFERNLTELLMELDSKDPNRIEFGHMKETIQLEYLIDKLDKYPNLKYQSGVKFNKKKQTYVDLDLAVYDKKSKTLILNECKNFLKPDSVREHNSFIGICEELKCQEGKKVKKGGVLKAISQVDKLEEMYLLNEEKFLGKVFLEKLSVTDRESIIILKDYLGNINVKEKKYIINHILFETFLRKAEGDLEKFISYIRNIDFYIPKEDREYEVKEREYIVNNFRIKVDMYVLKKEGLKNYIERVLL